MGKVELNRKTNEQTNLLNSSRKFGWYLYEEIRDKTLSGGTKELRCGL